jgi:hypothetical protein
MEDLLSQRVSESVFSHEIWVLLAHRFLRTGQSDKIMDKGSW